MCSYRHIVKLYQISICELLTVLQKISTAAIVKIFLKLKELKNVQNIYLSKRGV